MSAPIELIRASERMTVYGEAKLNAALAEGWQRVSDLTPAQQEELANRPPIPWKGYDTQNVDDVLRQAQNLPPERIAEVVRYESATKGRVSILGKLTGRPGVPAHLTPQTTAEEPPLRTIETVKEAPLKTVEVVEIVEGRTPDVTVSESE